MVYDCLLCLCTGFTYGTERFLAWSGMESGNAFREIKKDEPTTHQRLPTVFSGDKRVRRGDVRLGADDRAHSTCGLEWCRLLRGITIPSRFTGDNQRIIDIWT